MKLISWNVNGLRACAEKGFSDFFKAQQADFFCVQETKLQPEQISLDTPGYRQFWHSAERKGYSGTAIFAKHEPLGVQYDFGTQKHTGEGRVITLEYPTFYLVNAYVPNAKQGLLRLDDRLDWEDTLRGHLTALDAKKPVIYCGDLNVAHREIDLKNPKSNTGNPGFTPEEREKLTKLLVAGFTDTFRLLYPDLEGAYSWWSYRFHAREKNAGWRIDYFLVSNRLAPQVTESRIYADVFGSDHCPVGLELDISPV